MQPRPKRVGSSEVNIRTSMLRLGTKPLALRPFTAAMAPITPRVPSYAPASGIASQCDPVTTGAAAVPGLGSGSLFRVPFLLMKCLAKLRRARSAVLIEDGVGFIRR